MQFGIPRTWHFCYAQLHHTAVTQFGIGEVQVQNISMVKVLLDPDLAKRISRYHQAVGPGHSRLIDRATSRWEGFVPELSEELWQEALDTYLGSVISSTDKMIQLRTSIRCIIHWSDYFLCTRETLLLVINVWGRMELLFIWRGNVSRCDQCGLW